MGLIAGQQGAGAGDVETAVGLEAPSVERHGDVVGQLVHAGEIEVDRAGEDRALEEDVVREVVGVDHAARQVRGPVRGDVGEIGVDHCGQAGLKAVSVVAQGGEQRPPGVLAQVVGAGERKAVGGEVQARQALAGFAAVNCGRPPNRQSGQEAEDRAGLSAHALQRLAGLVDHRRRRRIPVLGQPACEPQEERQLVFADPLFVDRQDEAPGLGLQQKVGVLHAFGDPLERQWRAEVEVGQEGVELLVGDVCVYGHARPGMREAGPGVKPRLSKPLAA